MFYSFCGRNFDKHKRFFPYDYKSYYLKVDLQYGELYFTKKLISFSGKCLPLNLSLKYSQMHVNTYDNLHTYTGFPKGFKTNYHVVLEYDSAHDKYIYEDKDGFKHEFELADNSSTLYFDTFCSGLMLTIENNGYKVFDDDGNYQLFDQYGRLAAIHRKITSSHYAEQSITYLNNTSLKISSVTDNYGRTISFSYSSSSIQISYGNNAVVTLCLNNNLLTKISKNIGNNHIVEETFTHTSNRLTSIAFDSGEIFSFSYSNDQINCFVTNIKQDVFTFDYDLTGNTWASVTNQRGVSTRYDFSENESISQTSENNANLDYFKINSDIASCLVKDANGSNEIIDFLFGVDSEASYEVGSYSFGYSQPMTNNILQPKKMYLFVAEITGNLGTEHFDLSLTDYDDNLLAKLVFKGHTKILAAPVGIRASTPKSFSVAYSNFAFNNITIVKARLLPLIGDFEMLCSNVNTYGPIFFYGDTPYYLFLNGIVDKINNSFVGSQQIEMQPSDYLMNEKPFYKRNGGFRFWGNDKKKLFDNVSSAFILLKSNTCIGFDLTYGKIALYDSSCNFISDLVFYSIKGKDDNSFIVTKKSHNSSSFHTGHTSYYYEEEETKYIAGNLSSITYYDYDSNYLLKEMDRNDGYKEMYSYDSNGNLENKVISHTNINQQFVSEYEYDSNDNLIREYKLVGSSAIQIDYSYDNFGNLFSIDYPNQSSKSFAYDNVTGERNLNSHFSAPNISVIQNNNYIDSDNSSLSVSNDTYLFTFDAGRLTGVSYNDQQIVAFTHHQEIYSDYPLNTRYVTFYSNGYYAHTVYDAFDRLLSKEGLVYTYDDLSNVTNIYDDTLGGFDPNTNYTYDYFNLLTNVEVESSGLLIDYSYDIYHRLTNELIKYNNSNLYSISYSYYNKPNLENTIKQSSISDGSSLINVIDNVDDFSRLISQNISFGTNAFSKTIEYCVGGFNNTLTNNMISKVSLNYVTNGIQSGVSEADVYSYDNLGNIISIQRTVNNNIVFQNQYEYDKLSRLNRENNQLMNRSYRCVYNSNGNISFKKEYAYTTGTLPATPLVNHTYSYSGAYPSRLISFDGQTITYDNVGNPITYRGKTLTWVKGTLLSQVVDGNTSINLSYDGFKQRIAKSVNNDVTNYKYINNQLVIEECNNGTITYLYSHEGVVGFVLSNYGSSLNGVYLYEKNIQQDVVTIRDINNQIKAIYIYDAWGKHKVLNSNGLEDTSSSFIGNINPIRYRSYYYDTDLKMYWLTTRYYDPEVGRFISPDHYSYLDHQKLHGLNLYAYSKNNPVMYYDPSGHFVLLCAIIIAVIIDKQTKKKINNTIDDLLENENRHLDRDKEDQSKVHSIKLNDGTYVYYTLSGGLDDEKTVLKILDCWQYSREQITEFAYALKGDGNNKVNARRIINEWVWHAAAFYSGYDRDATRSADIFLDSDDIDHDFFSWVINNIWWFAW